MYTLSFIIYLFFKTETNILKKYVFQRKKMCVNKLLM